MSPSLSLEGPLRESRAQQKKRNEWGREGEECEGEREMHHKATVLLDGKEEEERKAGGAREENNKVC